MINYTQEITAIDVNNENLDTPNLITGVHVVITATDDTDGISSAVQLMLGFTPPKVVTPISDLTKELAESWVVGDDRIDYAKETLVKTIENIRLDKLKKSITPPWVVPTLVPTVEVPPPPAVVAPLPTIEIQKVVV